MSKNKHVARHASKQSSNFARVTTAVAVTGGLAAGIAVAESAGASSAPVASASAATQPLRLKAITPAKSLEVKAVRRVQAAKPKAVAPVQVSRSHVRAALTTPAAGVSAPAATTRDASAGQVAPSIRHPHALRHVAPVEATHAYTQVRRVRHRAVRQAVTTRAYQPTAVTRSVPAAGASRSNVVAIASGLTGIPYVWGGSTTAGFDCSGFVSYVYAQIGIHLPHQSGEIRAMATPVSDPRPGDLVFLPGHVAIYAGNGMVYEAHHPGTPSGLYPLLPGSTFGRV